MVTNQRCSIRDYYGRDDDLRYYWRWTIECYFKLLKQAGHDIEAWLQTRPEAILRRLLISCMACVLTWRIQRSEDEHHQKIRVFSHRLSGRQQKEVGRKVHLPYWQGFGFY